MKRPGVPMHQIAGYLKDVLPTSGLPPITRSVAIALLLWSGSKGEIRPAIQTVADVLGRDDGTVRAHLLALESAGVVAIDRREGKASVYRFPIAAFIHNRASLEARGSEGEARVLDDEARVLGTRAPRVPEDARKYQEGLMKEGDVTCSVCDTLYPADARAGDACRYCELYGEAAS